jgi:hypothetical protein
LRFSTWQLTLWQIVDETHKPCYSDYTPKALSVAFSAADFRLFLSGAAGEEDQHQHTTAAVEQ